MIRGFSPAILVLSLVFVVKALYLAFFVTPLWDIPDEIGHYSYALNIAEGRGIPKLGSSMIPAQVMEHVTHKSNAAPQGNWIAQHPPLYYILAAVPLKIGMSYTDDPEILFRLPRIIAAISGALLILVLYKTIKLIGLDDYRATLLGGAIGFIPMVSHLSSGTNHDMTLFLFSGCGLYFFTRFIVGREVRDVYLSAIWVTLASGVKMTAWVLIPPVLLIYALEIGGPVRYWLRNMVGVGALMLVSPVIWMFRNFMFYGDPLYTANTDAASRLIKPLSDTFLDYVYVLPVYDHLLLNFYGLIGWNGSGAGELRWFQVAGMPRAVFSLFLLVIAMILIISVGKILTEVIRVTGKSSPSIALCGKESGFLNHCFIRKCFSVLLILIGVISCLFIYLGSHSAAPPLGEFRILFAAVIVAVGLVSLPLLIYVNDANDRIMLYSFVIVLFFVFVLLFQLYGIYLNDGRLRATHGRYLYPVVPFFVVALSVAVQRLRVPRWPLVVIVLLLSVMELEAFIVQVIPFYEGGV